MKPQTFLLRDLGSSLNALTPSDKMVILGEVTFDANGQAVWDLSNFLKRGAAPIWFCVLGQTTAYSGTAGVYGTAAIVISNGMIPICISAATEGTVTGGNATHPDWPAASTTCLVLAIINQEDLAMDGG